MRRRPPQAPATAGRIRARPRRRPPPSPAPIEAASLPARPSMPSMKLNRLMNHSQHTAATIRSGQNGSQPWNTSEPAGNAVSPIATAAICIPNRSLAERLRRSSIQDIAIRPTASGERGKNVVEMADDPADQRHGRQQGQHDPPAAAARRRDLVAAAFVGMVEDRVAAQVMQHDPRRHPGQAGRTGKQRYFEQAEGIDHQGIRAGHGPFSRR